jgi:hypothetical protein
MSAELSAKKHPEATARVRVIADKASYTFWPKAEKFLKENSLDKGDVVACLRECEVLEFDLFANIQRYRVSGNLSETLSCEIIISILELDLILEVIHLNATE